MSNYKLIIFDCDGVLVDSEMISAKVIADVIRPLGIDLSVEESYKTFVGGSMAKTLAYVEERIGKVTNVDIEKEYRRISFEEYQESMRSVNGVIEILENLKIDKCVGSNGPRHKIELNLELTDLKKFFRDETIFSAYDIQKWKPDPGLYLNAARTMGVSAEECIVIEDSVHGLMAARSAGMFCLGNSFHLNPLPDDIDGTEIYNNMYEVKDRLRSLRLL